MTEIDSARPIVCFDADVLIFAAMPDHPLRGNIRSVLGQPERFSLCGSVLLLPEVLIKPQRVGAESETRELNNILSKIDLWPATRSVGELAVDLGARYGLATIDATHLASAVDGGADVFLTNNRRDFDPEQILELDVLFPEDLSSSGTPPR